MGNKLGISFVRMFVVAASASIVSILLGLFILDSNSGITTKGLSNLISSCFFIGLIAGAIVDYILQYAKTMLYNAKIDNIYNDELRRVAGLEKKDAERVALENKQRIFLVNEKNKLVDKKSEPQRNIQEYYEAMQIDPDYRSLIPLGYMYEYARLDIATKLEGVDGLYNLVRNDLRQDQFMCKLEDISQKMDQMIDNQHAIYTALTRINHICSDMVKSVVSLSGQVSNMNVQLSDMSQQSRITSYNSERARKELEYQGFMKSISG